MGYHGNVINHGRLLTGLSGGGTHPAVSHLSKVRMWLSVSPDVTKRAKNLGLMKGLQNGGLEFTCKETNMPQLKGS